MRDDAARRARWLSLARTAWLILLGVLLVWTLARNRAELADLLTVRRPALLAAALVTSAAQLMISARFWVRALGAAGQGVTWSTTLRATARSVPARYVPGSVWYAVSRVGMLRAAGVRLSALTVTATLEAVLTVLVSLALGGALLGAAGRLPGDELAGVAWVVVAAVVASPPVLNRALRWAARRRGTEPPALSWQDLGVLTLWMTGFWALSATTFTLYLSAFDVALPGAPVVAGVFLVAWAVGFLTPIAPQGAGAFEVTVAALLGGPPGVVVLVAGYRALIGLRDALAFAWGAWRGPVSGRPRAAGR